MTNDIPYTGTFINGKMYPTGVLPISALSGHLSGMLPNNLASLRKAKGFTQTQLANAIGTTLPMLGKLERGERKLDIAWMEKIAEALDIDAYELILPSRILPTEDELADMLLRAQSTLPAGLPYSEWPRAVAAGLHMRLQTLSGDRAKSASADDAS